MMNLVEMKGYRFIKEEEQYTYFASKTNEEMVDYVIKTACSVLGNVSTEDKKVADYNMNCAMEYLLKTNRGKAKKNAKILKEALGDKFAAVFTDNKVIYKLDTPKFVFVCEYTVSIPQEPISAEKAELNQVNRDLKDTAKKVEELFELVQKNNLIVDSNNPKVLRLIRYNKRLGRLINRHKELVSIIG